MRQDRTLEVYGKSANPSARIGDDHKCPMVDPGPKPHVGGPILAPCHPETKAGSIPMATVTDKATCQGPTDFIVTGSGSVLIGKKPAARQTDKTMHGGVKVTPPQHIIEIDPYDGKIFRDESCASKQCSVGKALSPEIYMSITLTWDEYNKTKELFYKMSPQLWALFETGSTNLEEHNTRLTKDYYAAFKKITSKSLLPYYHAIAPDFFKWLDQVAR